MYPVVAVGLLLLARADNGRLDLEREPVRLDSLAQALAA